VQSYLKLKTTTNLRKPLQYFYKLTVIQNCVSLLRTRSFGGHCTENRVEGQLLSFSLSVALSFLKTQFFILVFLIVLFGFVGTSCDRRIANTKAKARVFRFKYFIGQKFFGIHWLLICSVSSESVALFIRTTA